MLGSYGGDAYNIVKVLHILCAIIGFGAVTLNGLYARQIKARGGTDAVAIGEAVYRVSIVGEYVIYAVFVLGIGVVAMGDNLFDFGQTWVWLSIVLYVAGLGLAHGVLRPRVRRLNVLLGQLAAAPPRRGAWPPPQAAVFEALGKQVGATEMVLNLLLVTILVFMIFKPGGPSL